MDWLPQVFPFLTLHELCASCVRVCRAWRDAAYSDSLWRVIDFEELRITNDDDVGVFTRRENFSAVREIVSPPSRISGSNLMDLINKCPSLTSLKMSLYGSMQDKKGKEHVINILKNCPNLESLHIWGNLPSDILEFLPKLRHVYAFNGGKHIEFLTTYPQNQLTFIRFAYCNVTPETVKTLLQRCQTIETLKIPGSGFNDSVVPYLPASLRVINIQGSYDISDFVLQSFASKCPNLEHFQTGGVTISHDDKGQKLTFCAKVTDAGLLALGQLQHLKYLGLFGCSTFSAAAIEKVTLARKDTLTGLNIGSMPKVITDQALENIAKNTPKLRKISVDHNDKLSFMGWEKAAQHWKELRKVRAFECLGFITPLPDEEKVQWGWNLQIVNIYSCKRMKDETVVRIAEMCGKTLQKLTMNSCQLGSKAFTAIGDHCSILKLFRLGGTHGFADPALAHAISSNTKTLQDLDIWYTDAGPKSVEAVQQCTQLRRANLIKNVQLAPENFPFLYYQSSH